MSQNFYSLFIHFFFQKIPKSKSKEKSKTFESLKKLGSSLSDNAMKIMNDFDDHTSQLVNEIEKVGGKKIFFYQGFFSLKKSKQFKKQYLNVFNSYFLNKNLNRSIFLNFKLYNNISILQKNSSFRSFNYNFFFSILSLFFWKNKLLKLFFIKER